MKPFRFWITCLVFLVHAYACAGAGAHVVQTDPVRTELLRHVEGATASSGRACTGSTCRPGHAYWKNPGDCGEPTDLEWTLPEGASAGRSFGRRRNACLSGLC